MRYGDRQRARDNGRPVIQDVGHWWPQDARDVRFVSLR